MEKGRQASRLKTDVNSLPTGMSGRTYAETFAVASMASAA
eukprot:CAMPEP_0206517138 /NCGR_PEP_ID=MMETSP0324_2-20121206/63790_1 /ASSEMBLY_ACC=CAM_ASM_000836 /TAXON_ID=2866 /ORGANISM="Crypthecodinium cohnii, Strain Seligo" /LENGTH=39 /DNA_ID= /DNA_START= /DNA_END= /DNA_ORIENTATION=